MLVLMGSRVNCMAHCSIAVSGALGDVITSCCGCCQTRRSVFEQTPGYFLGAPIIDNRGALMESFPQIHTKSNKMHTDSVQKKNRSKLVTRRRQPPKVSYTMNLTPMLNPRRRRTIFTSIAVLQRDWANLDLDLLEHCLLILDCDRRWVFHEQPGAAALEFYKTSFDAHYVDCSADLLAFIKSKEMDGHVHWFRPEKSWPRVSIFLQRLTDHARCNLSDPEVFYGPLILDDRVWKDFDASPTGSWQLNIYRSREMKDRARTRRPRFTASIQKVITNFKSRSFEEFASKELLYQSNPSLKFYGYDLTQEKTRDRRLTGRELLKRGKTKVK